MTIDGLFWAFKLPVIIMLNGAAIAFAIFVLKEAWRS